MINAGKYLRAGLFILQISTAFFFLYLLIQHFTSYSRGLYINCQGGKGLFYRTRQDGVL